MNKLPIEKRTLVLHLLMEGNSLRSASRLAGVSFNSVKRIFIDTAKACLAFHHRTVRGIQAKRVQADELWSFVYSKEKNTPEELQGTGIGNVWVWVAMDADTKLVVSYYVGNRDAEAADIFMHDLASRLRGRIQLTTDGYKGYLEAVDNAFRLDIDYAQYIKIYANKKGETTEDNESKKHNRFKGSKVNVRSGTPRPKFISTSYSERQNLTMRTNIRRLTRKTNAFSKKFENHCYSVALHYVYYNFVRIHQSLSVTPAMQAGLMKKPMTIAEIAKLVPEPVAKRGPYKKKGPTEVSTPQGQCEQPRTLNVGHSQTLNSYKT
jgi:IS1 family transposase